MSLTPARRRVAVFIAAMMAAVYCLVVTEESFAVEIVNYPSPVFAVDEKGVNESFDNKGSLDQYLQIRSSDSEGQLGGVTYRLPGDLNWTDRCDDRSNPLVVFFPKSNAVGSLSEGPHDIEIADDYSLDWYFANYPGLGSETYAKCQDPNQQPAGLITRVPVIVDKSPPTNPVITATALTSTTAHVCVSVSDPLSGLADVKLTTPKGTIDYPLNGEKTFDKCEDINFGFSGVKAISSNARDFTRHTSTSATSVTLASATPTPGPEMTKGEAKAIATRKLARAFGKSWRKGTRKSVSCREFEASFKCRGHWIFKKWQHSASVTVSKTT